MHHEELRELCENIIATQTAEIELMQSWLCHWYGICERLLPRTEAPRGRKIRPLGAWCPALTSQLARPIFASSS